MWTTFLRGWNSLSGGFTSKWNGSQFTITAIPEPAAPPAQFVARRP
jgi:hypothetical protein